MGIRTYTDGNNQITMLGNFAKVRRGRPTGKNRYDKEYKAIVPYEFKWRTEIGKVRCTCVECVETYMPWYGFTFYHSKECALMKLVQAKPQLMNLGAYQRLPMLAQSE